MDAFEREEKCLEEQYENGELSNKEFTDQVNELYRDHRAAAYESAQRAYDDEVERW
jgi:hypothetical protein